MDIAEDISCVYTYAVTKDRPAYWRSLRGYFIKGLFKVLGLWGCGSRNCPQKMGLDFHRLWVYTGGAADFRTSTIE